MKEIDNKEKEINEILPERSDVKPPKVGKIKTKTKESHPLIKVQEENLLERLNNRSPEEKKIDIALSGTSATLVI